MAQDNVTKQTWGKIMLASRRGARLPDQADVGQDYLIKQTWGKTHVQLNVVQDNHIKQMCAKIK